MAGRMYQTSEEQANRLFQQKTVAEIKSIEKQTRYVSDGNKSTSCAIIDARRLL